MRVSRFFLRPSVATSTVVALLALASALALPAEAGAGVSAGHSRAVKGGPHQSTTSNLIDHGGKILPASSTYAIWWGPLSGFPSDAVNGMQTLLAGFNNSNYLGIALQYMRGASSISSSFRGSLYDASPPPNHQPQVSAIVSEVGGVLSRKGITPDPNAVYFVYTSNYPKSSYCAWHSAGQVNGVTVQVAYMPNTSGVAGCDPGDLYSANKFSEGTRSLADSTAHEFMESVTDAVPTSAWADKNGAEIGDKCNFQYSGVVTLGNKSTWQLQQEWSNAVSGCVQGG